MTRLRLVLSLLFVPCLVFAEFDEREVDEKTVELTFATVEEAREWSLASLSFPEWLESVAIDDWELLHKSETPEFYFAIYRADDHLIQCATDRTNSIVSSAIGVKAKDGSEVVIPPSKWVTLNHSLEYPNGKLALRSKHYAFQIDDSFEGTLVVRHSFYTESEKNQVVFEQEVPWKQPAE